MTKKTFSAKGHKANGMLELVHIDVCFPMIKCLGTRRF
jgi:hypothetical protein